MGHLMAISERTWNKHLKTEIVRLLSINPPWILLLCRFWHRFCWFTYISFVSTDASFMSDAYWRRSFVASVFTSVCVRWRKQGPLVVSRSVELCKWVPSKRNRNLFLLVSTAHIFVFSGPAEI